jgi:signal transduction histidine kinase
MNDQEHARRYRELQDYVGWTGEDAIRVASVGAMLDPFLPGLVDDFYAEISRHSEAQKVITGGDVQVARLKTTLVAWLRELLSGRYDASYVERRWRVGYRHVEIGLNQVYTNVALSRLRRGLNEVLSNCLRDEPARLNAVRQSLMTLIDLDLAIIEDAYQTEFSARQQRIERLATIGQVAGGVAHELRNPLNVVKTSVYYLLNARQPNPEKVKDHLQRIGRQVEVADDVISALSDFAKLPVPEQKPTELAACIDGALKAEDLPGNIAVSVSLPPELPRVLVDEKQVRIALGNLLRNACDAMPGGGRLEIQATGADSHVDVAISDTGVGIPADHLRQIMEPFFSTKARGIGLGLALTRAILDKNRGSLRVTSEVGKGSTFVVRLVSAPDTASMNGPGSST